MLVMCIYAWSMVYSFADVVHLRTHECLTFDCRKRHPATSSFVALLLTSSLIVILRLSPAHIYSCITYHRAAFRTTQRTVRHWDRAVEDTISTPPVLDFRRPVNAFTSLPHCASNASLSDPHARATGHHDRPDTRQAFTYPPTIPDLSRPLLLVMEAVQGRWSRTSSQSDHQLIWRGSQWQSWKGARFEEKKRMGLEIVGGVGGTKSGQVDGKGQREVS